MITESAHKYWNEQWVVADAGSKWAKAELEVLSQAATLPAGARVLALGAGIGRHALAFAEMGFTVAALDAAPESVSAIISNAKVAEVVIDARLGMMTELPFDDASFDHVLSWNVIYHGDERVVQQSVAEILRVLTLGGTVMCTMLSARRLPVENAKAKGTEISRNTWVFEGPGDKVHPRYFCNAGDLLRLFSGFGVLSLVDREHETPGSWHWHLLAERLV